MAPLPLYRRLVSVALARIVNPDKDLYQQLRALSCEQLWREEVAKFDKTSPAERLDRVAVVRAVGVVFSESGTAKQKDEARQWFRRLLHDPSEKIRRYAMTAIPKIGAGIIEETELLALLRTTAIEREKKFLAQTLEKFGGAGRRLHFTNRAKSQSEPRSEHESECH
jgi:hypothetical protein